MFRNLKDLVVFLVVFCFSPHQSLMLSIDATDTKYKSWHANIDVGENEEEIKPTLHSLYLNGIGGILDYAAEVRSVCVVLHAGMNQHTSIMQMQLFERA